MMQGYQTSSQEENKCTEINFPEEKLFGPDRPDYGRGEELHEYCGQTEE
jgi:hypothetical protein